MPPILHRKHGVNARRLTSIASNPSCAFCKGLHDSLGRQQAVKQQERALGPHGEQLEGDAGGPLLVLHAPEGGVAADAVRVQRQAGRQPDLQVRLRPACAAAKTTALSVPMPSFRVHM
jgi:hypothetical protein